MAGKAQTPPPIDRPLSKAYLRKFTGWSTAAPPGTSDPTSLRVMHNCSVDSDGSLRIRPGLQHVLNEPAPGDIVGTFEHFYTTDGRKAILFAYRDIGDGGKVKFCTAVYNSAAHVFDLDATLTTHFPGAVSATLAFNSSCTYVKYVQIDNRILALSDSGEPFRVFWVGSSPKAKKITAITKPTYELADALTVIEPDDTWRYGTITRTNRFPDPRAVAVTYFDDRYGWGVVKGVFGADIGGVSGLRTYVASINSNGGGSGTGRGIDLFEATDYAAPRAGKTGCPVVAGQTITVSAWVYSTKACTMQASARAYTGTAWVGAAVAGAAASLAANVWQRFSVTITIPDTATDLCATFMTTNSVSWAANDEVRVSGVLFEAAGAVGTYFDGTTANGSVGVTPRWKGATNASWSMLLANNSSQNFIPSPTVPTTSTLISSDSTKNTYSFGYFYSFNNEIGETPVSRITVVKGQRRWTGWNVDAADDRLSPDQLVAIIPKTVYDAAIAQGAISWNLYFVTWSDQDSVPVEGVLIKTVDMEGKTHDRAGWTAHTPLLQGLDGQHALPNPNDTDNFTDPSTAGQGLVAGDRLVLVYDKLQAARIRWSSNQQGDYLNFSASKGGGYKTLTSGNLFIPACVKLWQNPQSVDTITVLCQGLDGYGTAYYMSPGTAVTTQTQQAAIMGFEETTATPGTVSPYGCEVMNNALYHPLDNNLMKSTASNYNINHATMADPIENLWRQVSLANKRKMVSCAMSPHLYYLVQSPVGKIDAPDANGNQVWVCDTAQSNIWSCWDVEGTSLRKLEINGLLYMAITSGPSIFVFNPEKDNDDIWDDEWVEEGIPWEIVTNTQGANRAHDMWATLQQANVTFGNFTGECVYGVRGVDVNGKEVDVSKHYVSAKHSHSPLDRYDQSDFLLIRRIMMEWEFYWRSADRPKNRSYGSISFVQFRIAPASVNVGYEYGSIESFEYGTRDAQYFNGVPYPNADTRTP